MPDTSATQFDPMVAVTALVVISGAAERLVEIIKGLVPMLATKFDDPVLESHRRTKIHVLTLAVCVGTALLAQQQIMDALGQGSKTALEQFVYCLGLGVLSVGGSSFWNSILTYLVGLKDIKKVEASEKLQAADTQRAVPVPVKAPDATLPFGSRPMQV